MVSSYLERTCLVNWPSKPVSTRSCLWHCRVRSRWSSAWCSRPARTRLARSSRYGTSTPPPGRSSSSPTTRPPGNRTIGKTYTTPDGKTFRPSLFVTLTCPSYGRVGQDGAPADPDTYDYRHASRDALHFAALFDRFIQNLRRFCGYDLQYFAAIEPQRRHAPHVHIAIRGTISRAELREVIAATYHQVWWPSLETVKFDGGHLPVWDEYASTYLDPDTGEVLPTWDQALDAITDEDEPLHVARFGERFDAQGVLAGSKDASRCIGYLTKYLTKHVGDCHQVTTAVQAAHAGRLADALRYEPCSPTCANWLRYGIQPKNARPGLRPGCSKPKLWPIRQAISGLTWAFTGLAGWRSGYVKVSGMAVPMSWKACRWALVGSVSIGMVTWVPVYRTWLRVKVARCSSRPRKLR